MMFSGDDAEKKIKVLSGGERSRVLLGKLLVAPSNILFLDEPTHHLDIESCQAMMDAVRDFEGAALVVAHDEHFLNEVATKLIVFKNDRAFLYPGNYRDFLDSIGWEEGGANMPVQKPQTPLAAAPSSLHASSGQSTAPAAQPSPVLPPASKRHAGKVSRQARAEFVAMRAKILKPLEVKIKRLEDEIVSSEDKVKEMNTELARSGVGAIRRSQLSRELKTILDKIDSCYTELDTAMKEYDAAKLKYNDENN
jgi:ATP-binding cassette subfamily F protein 3